MGSSLTALLALKAQGERLRKSREQAEGAKRAQTFDVRSLLFQRQLEVLELVRTHRFHGVCCPRRSGKTSFIVALLFDFALRTGLDVMYVSLTRKAAKKTVWQPPKGLGIADIGARLGGKCNGTELSVTLPNGAHVYVDGAKDDGIAERFRGQAYALVVLDECQSIEPSLISKLVETVLEPTTADNDGTLVLAGTPAEFCSGLFWEICGEKSRDDYQSHWWSWKDNPYVAEAVQKRADKRREKFGDDDPLYQREYCGMWVPDKSSLCLPNFSAACEYTPDQLPPADRYWYSTIGIDIGGGGEGDPTVVGRFDVYRDDPVTYLGEERRVEDGQGKVTDTAILAAVEEMSVGRRVAAAVIDSTIAIAPARGRNFPILPAKKLEKEQQIRRMDDDFVRGVLKFPKGSMASQEARTVFWDKKALAKHKKKPTSAVPNDHLDAAQYGYAALVNLQTLPPPPKTLDERMAEEARATLRAPGNRDWKSGLLSRRH